MNGEETKPTPENEQAEPAKQEEPAPPSTSLDRIWAVELQGALENELKELESRLPEYLKRLRTNLKHQLRDLRRGAGSLKQDDAREKELIDRLAVLEKIARRLSRFRTAPDPSLEDLVDLSKRIAKANRQLGK